MAELDYAELLQSGKKHGLYRLSWLWLRDKLNIKGYSIDLGLHEWLKMLKKGH